MKPLSSRSRRVVVLLAGALIILSALFLVAFMQTRIERELSDLPVAERRALYERTRDTLQTTCMLASGQELTGYCRQQADFITRFPECDGECHALAARFKPRPTR